MKFSKLSQLFLVSSIGLIGSSLLTSCAIVTIDYVFVANSSGSGTGSAGQIQTYDSDSQTGALRPGAATVPSGGVNPIAMVATADYSNLYVINQGSNNVVHFALSSNGVLTQKDVASTSGTPTALAVNTSGTFLYVLSTQTSTALLTAYPLSSGTLGTGTSTQLTVPGFSSDSIVPTGITVLANNGTIQGAALFISAYDQSAYNPGGSTSSTANPGWVFGFAIGSGGTLTPATGSPYKAGVKPSAIISDPTDRFVYVTDFASNQLIGYTVQSGSTLDFLLNGPFTTATEPSAITIDPRGKYLYLVNQLSNSVSAYVIDLATGTPSASVNVTGSPINGTDTEPVSITADPAIGRFVYTANLLGNSISGFRLDPNTGALAPTQATPYPTGDAPSAILSVPHGNHSLQTVAP